MRMYPLLISFLFIVKSLALGQSSKSLDGQTLDFFHQSDTDSQDNDNEKFIFLAAALGANYDLEDGEWESVSYEFLELDSLSSKLTLNWGGEYAELTLKSKSIFNPNEGILTYDYFEQNNSTGEFSLTDTGTGDFTWSPSTTIPPINRFFEDDFSNIAGTSENFFLGNGETYRGLTAVQDTDKGEYSLEGLYTGDPDDQNHRWVDISANSLLPLNRSWIIDADPFVHGDPQASPTLGNIGSRLKIEWDGDAYMEIGLETQGGNYEQKGAFFYFDPPGDNDSFYEYVNAPPLGINENFKNFRLKNSADNYEISCSVVVRRSLPDVSPETPEFFEYEVELFRIYWEEGSYATKSNYSYYWNWRQIPGWNSLGDQYVQPSIAFQLPNQSEYDQESNTEDVTFKNLEAGVIGFRSFNVIHDPEIVDFDGGDEFPEFYNNLTSEVSAPNNSSRYHLLKGLHELAQIVESREANSLKQFLVSLGFEETIINFSLSDIPLAGEYEFEINREFQTGKLASTIQGFMIPKIESVVDHFSKVTDIVTIETSMTGMDEVVTVDTTDLKVLTAMAELLGTLASIQAGYQFDLNAGHMQDLDMELEEITLQSFREKYPNFLGIRDVSMHRKAKSLLESAVSTYKSASADLRTPGRFETPEGPESDFLFSLHEDDFEEEVEFISDLEELHNALSTDYIIEDDDPELNGMKISLSALFEGGLNIAQLLPEVKEDEFVSDQLTDPTLGGILPGASYANNVVLQDLQESFYEDEMVLGQRVLPDTLEEALAEFDSNIYLELNNEILDNWNVYPYVDSQSEDLEIQARQHFELSGYWEERRYFYYPYEIDGDNGSDWNNNQGELVFSTPIGLPVLYKDEKGAYNWSNDLNDILLWTVVANEGEDKSIGTAKFIDGHILYGFDTFSDDVADSGANKVTYTIDENGYIKSLEGDGEYQYYNAVRLEHGGIGMIQNDQGPESVADNGANKVDQWFFVSKESALAYYDGAPNADNSDEDSQNNDDIDENDNIEDPVSGPKPEFEGLSIDEVKDFVQSSLDSNDELGDARPISAKKSYDAFKSDIRFVYEIDLDNGITLYFDQNETLLHASPTGDFAEVEMEFISASNLPDEIKNKLSAEIENIEIIDAEKEYSSVSPTDNFIYNVFFDVGDDEFNAHFTSDFNLIMISRDDGGDFEDDWRPAELPQVAVDHLLSTYPDLVNTTLNFHVDERPTTNGAGKEFVVFLDDGTEVIFDSSGGNPVEFNPFKDFANNLDAGLEFDVDRSTVLSGDVDMNITKLVNNNQDNHGSMLYRITLNGSKPNNPLDISQSLAAGTSVTLTFTYDVGPPRYFIVSGANVTSYKHRMAEWDKPGSFTIKAETTASVASESVSSPISSMFGITVEMGGERFYEGAIFETNVAVLDVSPASFALPWDRTAAITINGKQDEPTKVKAYLPRRLLSGVYGIMHPDEVRAALIDNNGTLSYVAGSVGQEEEGNVVGSEFKRTPYEGHEPSYDDNMPYPGFEDEIGSEFKLDDDEFGFLNLNDQQLPQNPISSTQPNQRRATESGISASKFDFDGDGLANSYLKVEFVSSSFPAEVQIGDPFIDPFANLDDSQFGEVSGSVMDSNGTPLEEFDVWFFKVPQTGQDLYSGEPVFFNFERFENGTFTAKLPAGSYHAEAFAYDPKTDTPYKPKIAGGNENPKVFTIVGGDSKITSSEEPSLTFRLDAEFRMSNEFTEVEAIVNVTGGGKAEHVMFDLFPVDDLNNRLTDYPVFSFGIDRDGKLKGRAPVGTFEVEVFSPDNSVYFPEQKIIDIVASNNSAFEFNLSKRALVSVSGMVTDANNNGIWAEIVFVDPNNTDERFWPMWDESSMDLEEGEFAFKIPAGEYKIIAERFDGMFKSAYYDKNSDGVADIVSISESFSDDLNFTLSSRPTATVTLQLKDVNTTDGVKYAWFDFFDAEDEYAPIVFPHLGEINFESDFNGSYTLSVPGGTYKLAIGAPEYQNVFRVLNGAGTVAWQGGSWDDGYSITITDGETTDLGIINLTSFGKSDADLYGFDWLDEGEEMAGGSTISGTVKTSNGIAVPKARIIAHTVDYLFWFDHVQTRSNGEFKLENLPAGDWLVFAEPPFDSETFQGFRESNETLVSLSSDSNQTLDMVLQGSNVYGRILFPQKNRASGETKNQGLGNAFVWAYRDEDQDGEPDWDDEIIAGTAMLSEAFGETDPNGFFSFYLEEAGKYSMRVELPGQLGALAPEPIGFTLKSVNDSIKLGNAIKIDWKTDTRVTGFDIERKSSTASSYLSLFNDENNHTKPGSQAKSFVDPTVSPGETYQYRVIAETSSGKVTVDADKVRVSDPIIFLAPPSKTITGYVLDGDKAPIANAEVVAWREEGEGWSSTFTGDDGSYELVAGSGKWEITVYRPYDTKVDWIYDAAPERVKFSSGSKKEDQTKNFTVSRMSGGKITGTLVLPEGTAATLSDLAKYAVVDAFDPEGRGNWGEPDSTGKFEIPVQPGEYEVSLWVGPELQGLGSPEPRVIRVGKDSIDVGEIKLTSRDKTLSGVVKTSQDTKLANVFVWAWSNEGGWVSDTTNISGEYSLAISPGRWEVGFDLPVIDDGSEPPYLPSPPKRLKIREEDSAKTMDFIVREAGAKVTGVVYDSAGKPVSGLNAWVYAREFKPNSDDEYTEIVADVPLTSKGTFSFPGVPGEYMVGMWMPPGSDYGYVDEKYYKVEVADSGATVLSDQNGNIVNQASFSLSTNDSVISGTLKLSGNAISGITGEVYAMRVDGDGWQTAQIEDNGTYEMVLAAGNWALDYYIESDASSRNIPKHAAEPALVTVASSSTTVQNFILTTASASISGTVRFESNSTAVTDSSLFVWAYREGTLSNKEYWNEVESDENGTFTIPVLPGGKYEVGAILSQELREKGYLDSLIVNANLASGNIVDLNLTIAKPTQDNYISGTVFGADNNPVVNAFVYAWTDDGREVGIETNATGGFKLLAPKAVWRVGAEFAEIDENGSESYYSTDVEIDVNLNIAESKSGLVINLSAPDFEIPDGTSVTFDPNSDFVTQLPDGTELTIPGGAANVDSTVTEVRIVITPTAKGLSKSADEKPADYGYSIELFDNKGKKVEGNFKKDVILSIPVDVNASIANGMDVNNVEAMYYSTTKDAWDKAKTSTWDKNSSTLTMTTDHFTTFAAVSAPDVSDISSGLARVDDGAKGDWYSLDWLGSFYDATSGWIYHEDLGWLYTKEADNGNFWLYDTTLGWLWTGPTYFDKTNSEKSFLYSVTKARWLFHGVKNGERSFFDYEEGTNGSWITQ